jgi:hypothetical protein
MEPTENFIIQVPASRELVRPGSGKDGSRPLTAQGRRFARLSPVITCLIKLLRRRRSAMQSRRANTFTFAAVDCQPGPEEPFGVWQLDSVYSTDWLRRAIISAVALELWRSIRVPIVRCGPPLRIVECVIA